MVGKELRDIKEKLLKFSEKIDSEKRFFETKYGYFRNDGREFVIKTPKTPGLWANFLTNGIYTALITPTGGGYSWVEESGFNRVLRENPYSHLINDTPGRYIYIKDKETNKYWSITYQPVKKKDIFEAVHSLGYSSSSTTYQDIKGKIVYFIPREGTHEIWWVTLKNLSCKKRKLKLYSYSEFALGSYKSDITENQFNALFSKGEKYNNSLIFSKTTLQTNENIILSTYDKIGFFSCNIPFKEYELSKRDFIGFGNDLSSPKAILSDKALSSCPRAGENLIGCISLDIELKPNDEIELFFALGTIKRKEKLASILRTLTSRRVRQEFKEIQLFWDRYIKKVWINTPDKGLDIWFNYWLKYQTYFNAHWSEMDSFYIGGGGGYGVRDAAQHIWGVLPFEKDIYKKQLIYLLEHQYPDGKMPHAIRVFENEPVDSPHSDDACWLVFAVLNYLEETGDIDFLEEEVPFSVYGKKSRGDESGSVLRHLIRATEYSLRHLSERGIPQMRVADWNDGLSCGKYGKGESFLVAGLLAWNLKRFVELLSRIGRFDKVKEYDFAYHRLYESVKKFGWDGKWYLRATKDHRKKPIGSHKNRRGRIFLDSNVWICISQLAGSRTHETLQSLWEYLMTKYGALLFTPAYQKDDIEKGIISQFVPGAKENASIFLHANAWFMIALAQAGESEKAWELLKRINPIYAYYNNPEKYKVEPYVLPEFIFGKESDKFGEGSFTWVTGSAEWFLRGILDWFLGIRPYYKELIFEPRAPNNWEFSVEREFQGKKWRFEYIKGKKKVDK